MEQVNVGFGITATAIRVVHSDNFGKLLIGDNPRERLVGRVVAVDGEIATIDCGDDGTIDFFSFEDVEVFDVPTCVYTSQVNAGCPQTGASSQTNEVSNQIRLITYEITTMVIHNRKKATMKMNETTTLEERTWLFWLLQDKDDPDRLPAEQVLDFLKEQEGDWVSWAVKLTEDQVHQGRANYTK